MMQNDLVFYLNCWFMLPRKLVSTQGRNVQRRKLVKFCEKDTKLSFDKIAGGHVHSKLN